MHKRVIATVVAIFASVTLLAPVADAAAKKHHHHKGHRRGHHVAATTSSVRETPPAWTYMAKRMRPPKSDKWKSKWNSLGMSGWELVGVSDNMYIFKRSTRWDGAMASSSPEAMPKSHAKSSNKGDRYRPPASEGTTSKPTDARFHSRYGH